MGSRPSLLQTIVAWLRGEVPGAVLEAYQRASLQVHEQMDEVERWRLRQGVDGADAWAVPPAARAEMVCAWNAFALQTLGDALLAADYQESPATAGYVPRATAALVLRFYGGVAGWLSLARQARANPGFTLEGRVPAALPQWSVAGPAARTQLQGLLTAMHTLEGHVSIALTHLTAPERRDAAEREQLARIVQLQAAAVSTARYAEDLCGAAPDLHVRLRAEPHVRRAIELLYHLGQLAADPHLATAAILPAVLPPSPPPAPGILARLGRALPPPPAEPEELAHRDLSVRDVNGVEVRPNARIKHEHHGLGTYLGIGSRGSTLMRREDGVVVAFTDQDFRRIYEIGSGRRD